MPQSTVPQSVVDKDHELEGRHERASELLAKHRWRQTLDPAGPQYPMREYARAVERNYNTVKRYAKGYALYTERMAEPPRGSTFTIQDAIRLADQSAEMQEFSEAIAEGSGRPIAQVARGDNRRRTREIIGQAQERAERRGTNPVDEAREIAERQRRSRELAARQRRERAQARSTRYLSVEGHLAGAQRRLRQAMDEAVNVEFSDEEMELLRTTIDQIKALLRLLDLRMAGEADVDWDAELAGLNGGAS